MGAEQWGYRGLYPPPPNISDKGDPRNIFRSNGKNNYPIRTCKEPTAKC